MILRQTKRIAGYDCVRNPCGKDGCDGKSRRSHGICSDEWVYVVTTEEGDVAFDIVVMTGIFPDSVPPHIREVMRGYPLGTSQSLHVAFATERAQLIDPSESMACDYVTGNRCFGTHVWFGAADHFVKDHFKLADGLEQAEAFWTAFETQLLCHATGMRSARVDIEYQKCPSCDGRGTVRRTP